MHRNKSAEEFISNHSEWRNILLPLRKILLSSGLEESIKWGIPVYTLDGKNVAGLAAFKNHVAIWFLQGALLKDEKKRLVNAQEGITKAQRQWRFDKAESIDEKLISSYLSEAMENQKLGKVVKATKKKSLLMPPELETAFKTNKKLKATFEGLAPSKQREYAEYLTEAKREDTKSRRLAKIIPMILRGTGLNDRYKS